MALKLAGQDDDSSSKVNHDGSNGNNIPGANPWDAPKDNLNLEPIDTSKKVNNPWDNGPARESKSISQGYYDSVSSSDTTSASNGDSIVVKISGVLVFALFIISSAAIFWASSGKSIHVISKVMKYKTLFSSISVFAIIDAFIVFFLFEKRISLIIFSFMLQPFYPMKRNKVVNGSAGIGIIVTILYILAMSALITKAFKAGYNYGNIPFLDDEAVRTEVAEIFDEPMQTGSTYGTYITRYFSPETAQISGSGQNAKLIIEGDGYVALDGNTFVTGGSYTNTVLVFAKNSSGNYYLSGARLGNIDLTGQYLDYYKNMLNGTN